MSKFNTKGVRSANGLGIVESVAEKAINHKGGVGTLRPAKSELYLAVISDFGGEATFYETADARSTRISNLVRKIAVEDKDWLVGLAGWLRNEANLRSISLTVSLEGAKALNEAGIEGARQLVASSIRRADEPGEALAYWFANFGRKLPSAVKRGIADAAKKSYNEFSLGKYDTATKGFRFGDVIELTHPTPTDEKQSQLFKFALERRRNAAAVPGEQLTMADNRKRILALSDAEKRKLILSENNTDELSAAGLTWEVVAGSFGRGGLDAKAWEALIPTMGYMALLRNLRNFEQAGVSAKVLNEVANRIADPEQVAKSRQLPFRFLSAYRATKATGSLRFAFPLEQALNASLANVPELPGKTLILVDQSGSMFWEKSEKTELTYADTTAIFGSALALRAQNATLVSYGSRWEELTFQKNSSVLSLVERFHEMGGTSTELALRAYFKDHDRVILLTDEQSYGAGPLNLLPKNVKGYVWNLAGYKYGSGASGRNRTYLGGLSDQSFKSIPLLEAGHDEKWPWEA